MVVTLSESEKKKDVTVLLFDEAAILLELARGFLERLKCTFKLFNKIFVLRLD